MKNEKAVEPEKELTSVEKYFQKCALCDGKKKINGDIIDYDSLLPIDHSTANPVVFRLKQITKKKNEKKSRK